MLNFQQHVIQLSQEIKKKFKLDQEVMNASVIRSQEMIQHVAQVCNPTLQEVEAGGSQA